MSEPDNSFAINGRKKGSYIRAIEDIDRALKVLNASKMSPQASFLIYYIACEKLARIMKGISHQHPKSKIFTKGSGTPKAADIYAYSNNLRCDVSKSCIDYIFDINKQHSARNLRDIFIHDFGPTHARKIHTHSQDLVPKMKEFLGCSGVLIEYLKSGKMVSDPN